MSGLSRSAGDTHTSQHWRNHARFERQVLTSRTQTEHRGAAATACCPLFPEYDSLLHKILIFSICKQLLKNKQGTYCTPTRNSLGCQPWWQTVNRQTLNRCSSLGGSLLRNALEHVVGSRHLVALPARLLHLLQEVCVVQVCPSLLHGVCCEVCWQRKAALPLPPPRPWKRTLRICSCRDQGMMELERVISQQNAGNETRRPQWPDTLSSSTPRRQRRPPHHDAAPPHRPSACWTPPPPPPPAPTLIAPSSTSMLYLTARTPKPGMCCSSPLCLWVLGWRWFWFRFECRLRDARGWGGDEQSSLDKALFLVHEPASHSTDPRSARTQLAVHLALAVGQHQHPVRRDAQLLGPPGVVHGVGGVQVVMIIERGVAALVKPPTPNPPTPYPPPQTLTRAWPRGRRPRGTPQCPPQLPSASPGARCTADGLGY